MSLPHGRQHRAVTSLLMTPAHSQDMSVLQKRSSKDLLLILFSHKTPAVSVAKHDVSTGLPQPFSRKQQKKKMPTFLNLLVLFRELSGRCGASTRRSCGNVTFGSMSVFFCIKRSVSRVTKKHEDGRSTKRKVQCNNAYEKKTGVT